MHLVWYFPPALKYDIVIWRARRLISVVDVVGPMNPYQPIPFHILFFGKMYMQKKTHLIRLYKSRGPDAQSDQYLCYYIFVKYNNLTWHMQNSKILPSICSWAGWFEHVLVGNPVTRSILYGTTCVHLVTELIALLYLYYSACKCVFVSV